VSITRPDGTIHETQLYGVQGAAHILEVDSAGAEVLLPAKRLKTERRKNSDGTWRIYNLWQAPDGGTFREPVIDTDDDKLRKLNRAERLRSIPPTDPDYKELYGRRNDAEAQNRMLDDSLWLGRAHSMGAQRHLLDWLGYGLVVNAVARRRSRLARASQQGPQAA
jgi:hypothetical protein